MYRALLILGAPYRARRRSGLLLGRRLAGSSLLRGPRLLRWSSTLLDDGLTTNGQQFERTLRRHRIQPITLRQRCVGLAVRDVHTEPAIFGHDRLAADRVVTELAQRALGGHVGGSAAAEHLWLGEDRQRFFERDGQQLLFVGDVAEVLALLHVGPVTTVV